MRSWCSVATCAFRAVRGRGQNNSNLAHDFPPCAIPKRTACVAVRLYIGTVRTAAWGRRRCVQATEFVLEVCRKANRLTASPYCLSHSCKTAPKSVPAAQTFVQWKRRIAQKQSIAEVTSSSPLQNWRFWCGGRWVVWIVNVWSYRKSGLGQTVGTTGWVVFFVGGDFYMCWCKCAVLLIVFWFIPLC